MGLGSCCVVDRQHTQTSNFVPCAILKNNKAAMVEDTTFEMSYGHSTYNYSQVCRVTVVNTRINITKKSGTVPSHNEKLRMQKTQAEFRHPLFFEIHLLILWHRYISSSGIYIGPF